MVGTLKRLIAQTNKALKNGMFQGEQIPEVNEKALRTLNKIKSL